MILEVAQFQNHFSFHITECILAKDYELDRDKICLKEIIGEGQFGDVHKGTYQAKNNGTIHPVAVKTCKIEEEESMGEKFLEEACRYQEIPIGFQNQLFKNIKLVIFKV